MQFGEETITNLFMMDLYVQGSTVVLFEQTSKKKESRSGTDFELWVGSQRLGWFRFAVQAKKLNLRTGRYDDLNHKNSIGRQPKLLEQYAMSNMACPVYCLYNFTERVDRNDHWHCCDDTKNDLTELGCSMTSLWTIQQAITTPRGKNFRWIHRWKNTLPLRCLVACPKVQRSLEAKREGAMLSTMAFESSPLFTPDHCYYRRLPRGLSDPGDAVISENRHGGRLVSIRLDSEDRMSPELTRVPREIIDDFNERYSAESGPPRAASVIDIESQPVEDSDADHET
ncbi:MAG: hypothetical protein OXD46_07335 [Chloroflexi bacterium]|nr:hypothetical protein [Chloroflexota bacterium]